MTRRFGLPVLADAVRKVTYRQAALMMAGMAGFAWSHVALASVLPQSAAGHCS
jgi:hypothetical protein